MEKQQKKYAAAINKAILDYQKEMDNLGGIARTPEAEALEKNFIKTTGLKSSGIIQDVQISGTSELLNPNQGEEFSINARLNQNFSLSYKRSFSLEAAYKNKVGVEYKLNPNFSVIGNVDESGQVQMKFRVRRVY